MREDESEQPFDERQKWRAQIELPAELVDGFREWWDSEGWWSFRTWHERTLGSNSEWEKFMRRLCSEPPAKKLPSVCGDPTDPTAP